MALSLGINSKLTEVGRHMQSLWTTAVVHIEEDSYLVADHDGNLVVLRRNRAGVTMEDQKRLEVTSELNLGEVANKIVSVDVHASASAMVVPRAFIGTVSYLHYDKNLMLYEANNKIVRWFHIPLLHHLT